MKNPKCSEGGETFAVNVELLLLICRVPKSEHFVQRPLGVGHVEHLGGNGLGVPSRIDITNVRITNNLIIPVRISHFYRIFSDVSNGFCQIKVKSRSPEKR